MMWADRGAVEKMRSCTSCGSKNIDLLPVPGGIVEITCLSCGHLSWHETHLVDLRDPTHKMVSSPNVTE